MKKKYLFISLIFVAIGNAQIQTEDFEASVLPVGWTSNILTGNVDWTFGTSVMPSGNSFDTNAAIFDDDAAGSSETDNTVELLSPAIDLTGYSNVNLDFQYALQDYLGSGYFNVDVWNGTAWVQILTETSDLNPVAVPTIDVTSYINSAFQVRFTYGDDQDWAWGAGVDNFSLTGNLTTNSFEKSKYSIYPNPTVDIININTIDELRNITISDVSGKTIKKIANGTTKVDISNLDSGVYFLTYDTEGKHYLNKIVRK